MCVCVASIHMWVCCRGRLDVDVAACHAASSKQRVPFSVLAPRKVNGPCMFFPQPWRLTLFMMDGKLLFFSLFISTSFFFLFFFCCSRHWRHWVPLPLLPFVLFLPALLLQLHISNISTSFSLPHPVQLSLRPPVLCLFNHFVI